MKTVGRSFATILLLFALTTTAFAGQIDIPPASIPSGGQIEIPPVITPDETTTIDTLAEFALDIWMLLPSLF